jgi:integrase
MPKRIPPLSELQVKNAKPKKIDYKISDGYGLHLFVTSTGGKLWRYQYRYEGKQKLLSFGAYPITTLAEARHRRDEARKLLANEVDPGAVKKAKKASQGELDSNTFEVIAREWHEKFAHTWVASHAQHKLERLEKTTFPWIGNRPITELKATDVLVVLRQLETRGILDTAHRVRSDCGHIFRYAVATGRAERDPTTDLKGALPPAKNGHYAAVTDPIQLASLLNAIDGFVGSYVVKCALQLTPLLFVRPGELRHAEWSEFDFEAAVWNIPAGKMKMKNAHIVPLSQQVIKKLKDLKDLTGRGKYIFPSERSALRCISDNSVNAGLRRLGFEKTEVTAHGFRATARTLLHEVLQFSPDAIEAQLAHAVPDRLGTAYNRTQHLVERKRMMQVWADYLDGLKVGARV